MGSETIKTVSVEACLQRSSNEPSAGDYGNCAQFETRCPDNLRGGAFRSHKALVLCGNTVSGTHAGQHASDPWMFKEIKEP